MTRQGASQPCTCRSARGQDGSSAGGSQEPVGAIGEGSGGASARFFPRSRLLSEGEGVGRTDGKPCSVRAVVPVPLGPPAEAEGATDQRPGPADGAVGAHLKVGPPQFLFDRLAALLDPLAQAIPPHHLPQAPRPDGPLPRRSLRAVPRPAGTPEPGT